MGFLAVWVRALARQPYIPRRLTGLYPLIANPFFLLTSDHGFTPPGVPVAERIAGGV